MGQFSSVRPDPDPGGAGGVAPDMYNIILLYMAIHTHPDPRLHAGLRHRDTLSPEKRMTS